MQETVQRNGYANDDEPITHESVHELRQRVRYMRQTVEESPSSKSGKASSKAALADGEKFLSFVFAFILFVIVAVGFYAFRNLYVAIVKKFYPEP